MKKTSPIIDQRRNPDIFGYTSKSMSGKVNKRNGDQAERIVMEMLRQLGYKKIEKIETGFSVVRQGKRIVSAFPKAKVSGDIRAIGPGGITIHCEVKYRPNATLRFSDFEPHQLQHLQEVTDAGGIAYVAWVISLFPAKLYLLEWPVPIRKCKGLTREQAEKHIGQHFGFVNGNPM
jgi:recombination protein U